MIGKFKGGTEWIMPLMAHVTVHGLFTLGIAYSFGCKWAPLLSLLDMTIHFIMDRIKASPKMLGRFKALSADEMKKIIYEQEYYIKKFPGTPTSLNMQSNFEKKLKSNVYFWWSLGLDQMVHHLTDLLICYIIIRSWS